MKKELVSIILLFICFSSSFSLVLTSSQVSDNDEWVEYRIYNPHFNKNVLTIDSWESWSTTVGEATADSDSFWLWRTYEIEIKDAQAVGYKHTGYQQIVISYVSYKLQRGSNSWSGGDKNYYVQVKCDLAYLFPDDCQTSTGVISEPGTSYTSYSEGWGEFFYYYVYPTRYTFRIDVRVQMRNGDTVKADVTSTVSWQSYDTYDVYV